MLLVYTRFIQCSDGANKLTTAATVETTTDSSEGKILAIIQATVLRIADVSRRNIRYNGAVYALIFLKNMKNMMVNYGFTFCLEFLLENLFNETQLKNKKTFSGNIKINLKIF